MAMKEIQTTPDYRAINALIERSCKRPENKIDRDLFEAHILPKECKQIQNAIYDWSDSVWYDLG